MPKAAASLARFEVLDESMPLTAADPSAYVLMTRAQYELLADEIVHPDLAAHVSRALASMERFYTKAE